MFTDGRTDGQMTAGRKAHRYIPEPFGRGIKMVSGIFEIQNSINCMLWVIGDKHKFEERGYALILT